MTDLLPCPFCGGEAELLGSTLDGYRVACIGMCYCSTQRYRTKHEAISAWNTRAERTCTFSEGHNGNETEKMVLPKCSACGVTVDGTWCDDYYTLNGLELEYAYDYCPNCGSKVIEQ